MGIIVKYEGSYRPKDPILIEGLPGVGNVARMAAEHLGEQLKAERFATIYSDCLPAAVFVDEDSVGHLVSVSLWHAPSPDGREIVFMTGEFQPMSSEGQFSLYNDIFRLMADWGLSEIITLGGVGTGSFGKDPDVLAVVSRPELRKTAEKAGAMLVPGEPSGGIIGAAGLFLGFGQMEGVDSMCFVAECCGYVYDFKATIALLKVLKKLLKIPKLDLSELRSQAKKLDEMTNQAKDAMDRSERSDMLTYIGRRNSLPS